MEKSRCPAHDTERAGSSPARQQDKDTEGGRYDNSKQHTVAGLINRSKLRTPCGCGVVILSYSCVCEENSTVS